MAELDVDMHVRADGPVALTIAGIETIAVMTGGTEPVA